MLAGIYNILCEQGTTFIRLLKVEQPDPEDPTGETFIDFDLTGYTARMQIRRTITTSTPMIELTTENGGLEIGYAGEDNALRIHITAEQTEGLSSSGVYDLEIINSEGSVSRLIQGDFELSLEVTR